MKAQPGQAGRPGNRSMPPGANIPENDTGLPALVLVYQLDRDRQPVGVQLVGKCRNQARLLATAKALA